MTDETESTEVEAEVTAEPENISDLFNDDETEETATTSEEETGTEEESDKGDTETEGTDDSQAESDKDEETGESEETEDSSSETPSEEEGSVPRKALLDERRKRQELEEKLRELEPADEEAPDPTDDPEGYEKYLRTKWEREQWQKTANRSRDRMIETHPDYAEKEQHFLFLANQDPSLVQKMNDDPDPAAFAYKTAKESLDKQEKAIEDRVIERLRKEGKLKESEKSGKSDKTAEAASKVSDLTSATGAGKNTGEEPIRESVDPADVFDDLAY